MLFGSHRRIAAAPTGLLKGPCGAQRLCPQPALAGPHHHGRIYSLALRACVLHLPPPPYSDRLGAPPPVWSLFELLSGGDKQTCKIKTKASSVVP